MKIKKGTIYYLNQKYELLGVKDKFSFVVKSGTPVEFEKREKKDGKTWLTFRIPGNVLSFEIPEDEMAGKVVDFVEEAEGRQ